MNTPRQPRVTVFDLTESQLNQLESLDSRLADAKLEARKPSRLRAKVYPGNGDDYSIDSLYYDLAVGRRVKASDSRREWLKENRISPFVAKQARETSYRPHRNAEWIGLVAPARPAKPAKDADTQ
jgi:hypothetical protein